MGLDSDAAGGIDICADTNQYIDFTTNAFKIQRGDLFTTHQTMTFKCMLMGTPHLLEH